MSAIQKSEVPDVIVFESHPVQYRAPIYREIERLVPGRMLVAFATDITARAHFDEGFGRKVEWDIPLLEGYRSVCLNSGGKKPLSGHLSLRGRGVFRLVRRMKPKAILSTQFIYLYDAFVWMAAVSNSIPLWIRQETQDELFKRSRLKSLMRSAIYRTLYSKVERAFCFGELSFRHLTRCGIDKEKIRMTRFATVDRISAMSANERDKRRCETRNRIGVSESSIVVAFFGKLIPIKNPGMVIDGVLRSTDELRTRTMLLYVGTGVLEESLRAKAKECGASAYFAGFANQTELPDYYLAADILVLPSHSEAWGLVVNEALQAGCSVVVTSTVGCHPEFASWERVRVVAPGNAEELSAAIEALSKYERSFDWCRGRLEEYTVEANAGVIAEEIRAIGASS